MFRKTCLSAFLGLIFAILLALPLNAEEHKRDFPPQAILVASYCGDVGMVSEILAAGADKDARDSLGATALHAAMYQKNLMVVKLLLDNGFDPNARDTLHGYTPLHDAVVADNPEAAWLLIQYRADDTIKSLDGLTPLAKARQDEKRALVNVLSRLR